MMTSPIVTKVGDERNWERVLWKPQPFSDNYVSPRHFLASLRKNTNFTPYTYFPLLLASTSVSQHVATIYIFISIFIRLKENTIRPQTVVWSSIALFIAGYATWEIILYTKGVPTNRGSRSRVTRSSILVFVALLALSPVLKTLSEATSSDTIWALSFILLTLHTLLADYTAPRSYESRERLTSVLSMNAAISASVVLASRLDSDLSVFGLVLFAVQAFALFPLLRRQLQTTPVMLRGFITVLLAAIAIILMNDHSRTGGLIAICTLFFICFVSPALLVWAQKFKNEIRGEWDVAVPEIG